MGPHFKALCQTQPLHDPSQQRRYNYGEVWPTVPRIFFSKKSIHKMQHKKLPWSIYGWGESLGQRRTSGQAVCTSIPVDDHNNLFLISAKFLTAFVICMLYLLSYNPLRAEQLIGNKCCTMLMTRNMSSDTGEHLLVENLSPRLAFLS